MNRLESGSRLRILSSAAKVLRGGLTVAEVRPEGLPIVAVNPGFSSLTGYTPEEVLGRDCRFLQGPRTDRAELDRIRQALKARATVEARLLNYRRDGSEFWNELLLTPVTDDTGRVSHYVGLQRDVTEQVLQEQRLAQSNALLTRQAEELRELNRHLSAFSSAVAHDLRGPLGVVGSLAAAMETAVQRGRTDQTLELATLIGSSARRMSTLVDSLLQACRASEAPLQCTDLDLSRIAREVLDELRLSEPGRTVLAQVPAGLHARGDEGLLRSALANLLSNAWKYTRGVDAARIEFGRYVEDGTEVYFVRDNGAGFDADAATNLFEPFRRFHTDSEFAGVGLGLSTVRRIVQRHGGWIRARSRRGEGACFEFHLGTPLPGG